MTFVVLGIAAVYVVLMVRYFNRQNTYKETQAQYELFND